MDEQIRFWAKIAGAVGAVLVANVTPLIWTLLALMVLDTVSGLLLVTKQRHLVSSIGIHGTTRKFMILIVVGSLRLIEPVVGINVLDDLGAGFYIVHELTSIGENATALGVGLPPAWLAAIKAVLGKYNSTDGLPGPPGVNPA